MLLYNYKKKQDLFHKKIRVHATNVGLHVKKIAIYIRMHYYQILFETNVRHLWTKK